ncbi:hypothetical protein [Winogradskyella flava]|uniref:Uncharacterized protein n=1 Tax=Winogradskyella flava TaxID=1884876 RepID=A0A842IYX1_9FLAO|nr:hypothetical protein [Winogradskyella flava]MBC2846853.1 hypothetical protein [Winogradskyella flava]
MIYISQVVGIGAQRQCSNLSSPFGELYIIGFGYGFVTEWYASIIPP